MADALGLMFGLPSPQIGDVSFNNFSLNAATDQLEVILDAEDAISITRLFVRLGAITGTSPTYIVSLQGVGADGNPDGTILGGGTPASATFNPSGLGWSAGTGHWVTLDNAYTCTRGQQLAIVVAYSSGTIDGSNTASFTATGSSIQPVAGHPFSIANDGGSRTRSTSGAIYGYGSATKAYGRPLSGIGIPISFGIASSPDEWALAFTIPAAWGATFKVKGMKFWVYDLGGSDRTYRIQLYNGTTVLQTKTYDNNHNALNQQCLRDNVVHFTESSLSELTCGNEYRVGIRPDSGTSLFAYAYDVATAADWDAMPGGQNCKYSSRTDDGAWTDTATRRPMIAVILDDLTEPAGGGGGILVPIGMTGGFN